MPPDGFTEIEASLDPKACASCHEAQYQQWSTSLHAKTMGAGILWLLQLMGQEEGNRCLRCHAPLAEQKALVALRQDWPGAPGAAPPSYVPPDLDEHGLVCAACHVRAHQRFGPPPNKTISESPIPHGGFIESKAFEDSRFCATCHQFADDGPRINGKLQEDTYAQWAASPYKNERHCQSCHMPDRQHLFRGIHDKDMVRQALTIELQALPGREPGELLARALIRNTGAGHHFPTYMVPKVAFLLALLDANGQRRLELTHKIVGWGVDTYLTEELYDTRIPAGGEESLQAYFAAPSEAGWQLELSVEVAPGEHYERMFSESLKHVDVLKTDVIKTLRQALHETRSRRYLAHRQLADLPAPVAN
jgi:hypothetical protein